MALRNGQYTRTEVPALHADDSARNTNVHPRFFMEYRRNNKTSEIQAVEMVEVLIAGDTKNAPVEKVTDSHRAKWPMHYEAFKAEEEFIDDGTPLTAWGAIDGGAARTLMAMNIMTVEQLADISDAHCGTMTGGRTLRDKAKQYVEITTKNTEINRVLAEKAQMQQQMDSLQRQMSEMAGVLAKVDPEKLEGMQDSAETLATDLDSAIEAAPEEPAPQPEPPQPQSLAERLGTTEDKPKRRPGRPKKGSGRKKTA